MSSSRNDNHSSTASVLDGLSASTGRSVHIRGLNAHDLSLEQLQALQRQQAQMQNVIMPAAHKAMIVESRLSMLRNLTRYDWKYSRGKDTFWYEGTKEAVEGIVVRLNEQSVEHQSGQVKGKATYSVRVAQGDLNRKELVMRFRYPENEKSAPSASR